MRTSLRRVLERLKGARRSRSVIYVQKEHRLPTSGRDEASMVDIQEGRSHVKQRSDRPSRIVSPITRVRT